MFGRTARDLQVLLKSKDPTLSVFGHPRKGWEPIPVADAAIRPVKGAFIVKVGDHVVASSGPEVSARPGAPAPSLDRRCYKLANR